MGVYAARGFPELGLSSGQWTMASSSQPLLELQGPLLPPKDLVEEEDEYLREDAEEDEDTVFLDAEELCSGGVNAGSLPGLLRGEEITRPSGVGSADY